MVILFSCIFLILVQRMGSVQYKKKKKTTASLHNYTVAQHRRGPLGALGVGVVAACRIPAIPFSLPPAVLHLAECPLPVGPAV